jgi:hypothetical protein
MDEMSTEQAQKKLRYSAFATTLSEGQKKTLRRARTNKTPVNLKLSAKQLDDPEGPDVLFLTNRQLNQIARAKDMGRALVISFSKAQLSSQSAGFFWFLAPALAAAANIARTVAPAVAAAASRVAPAIANVGKSAAQVASNVASKLPSVAQVANVAKAALPVAKDAAVQLGLSGASALVQNAISNKLQEDQMNKMAAAQQSQAAPSSDLTDSAKGSGFSIPRGKGIVIEAVPKRRGRPNKKKA